MLAIGLMSGTSRDGIDAALIETDGEGQAEAIIFHAQPYSDDFRERLAAACARAMARSPSARLAPFSTRLTDPSAG